MAVTEPKPCERCGFVRPVKVHGFGETAHWNPLCKACVNLNTAESYFGAAQESWRSAMTIYRKRGVAPEQLASLMNTRLTDAMRGLLVAEQLREREGVLRQRLQVVPSAPEEEQSK